ncbi:MAG TPA: hypothetical protein VJG64_03050 [Candidatus Paceibacterota bacterium]
MSKLYVFTAAAFIVIGAGAFWAGMAYRSTLGAVPSTGVAGSGVSFAPPNGQKPPDVAVGHVESKQSSGFVVKASDGSIKTVSYTSTTSVAVTTVSTEAPDNVSVGDQVFVVGSLTSDGALAAQSIQIMRGLPAASNGLPAAPAFGQ